MNVLPSKLLITLFCLAVVAGQKCAWAAPLPPRSSPTSQPVVPGQPATTGMIQPTPVTSQPMTAQPATGSSGGQTAAVPAQSMGTPSLPGAAPQAITPQSPASGTLQPVTGMAQPAAVGVPQPTSTNITVPSLGATPPMGLTTSQPTSSVPSPTIPPAPQVPSKPLVLPPVVDYKKFRDPFKEPSVSEVQVTKSELERYGVNEFKVTGVITGPIRMRAMLLAPNGKTHYVSENMKLGTRDGVIIKITTKTVVVREKVVNPLGEVELFDTEIGIDQPTLPGTME